MPDKVFLRILYIHLYLILTTVILYFAKPVLMPLAIAGVLAVVFWPFCKWLEGKGLSTVLGAVICGLVFIIALSLIVIFVSWQIKHISSDLSAIKRHFGECAQSFKQYLQTHWGLDAVDGGGKSPIPLQPNAGDLGKMATSAIGIFIGLVINLILIFVYLIMLLCLRHQVKAFILKLVSTDDRGRAEMVIQRSALIIQQYLGGLAIVIVCLWVMYGIGFSIIGVDNAIFFAILCGLLEIIPFVGNITGSTLTCLMALSQGGGLPMVTGVLITYAIIQLIQFYIISPLVMREQVSIHPLFTIVVLIAGDLVWGIPGMILAIPLLGIIKIICDNVEVLQPFGYLVGHHKQADAGSKRHRFRLWLQAKLSRHSQ